MRMVEAQDFQLLLSCILLGLADSVRGNQKPIVLRAFFAGILRGVGFGHQFLTRDHVAQQQTTAFMRVSGFTVLSNLLQMLSRQLNRQGQLPPRIARSNTSSLRRKAPSQVLPLSKS